MKRLMILALILTMLLATAGIASAEHGNIGGIGTSITQMGIGRPVR